MSTESQKQTAQPTTKPSTAPSKGTPGGKDSSSAASKAQRKAATSWYVDFKGAGKSGEGGDRAAHGDRKEDDVLIVNNLQVGPRDEPHSFKGGNSLASNSAHLGNFEHPVGAGIASGNVAYAKDKDLKVELSWGVTPGKADLAEAAAARAAVESMVRHNINDPTSQLWKGSATGTGDWGAIADKAELVARSHLPDNAPKVTISHTGGRGSFPLEAVDYNVDGDSTCTAKVHIPTKTIEDTWSETRSGTKQETETETEGEKEKGGAKVHVEGSGSTTSTTGSGTKTGTKTRVEISFDEIKRTSSEVSTKLGRSFQTAFRKWVEKATQQDDAGQVEEGGEEEDLSLGDKVKGWFKDKAKSAWDYVKGKAVSAVKSFLASKIKKYLWDVAVKKGGRFVKWFRIIEWGARVGGWIYDKYKGNVSGEKTKTEEGPDTQTQTIEKEGTEKSVALTLSREVETRVKNETEHHFHTELERTVESENTTSKSDSTTVGGKVGVDVSGEKERSSGGSRSQAEGEGYSRTYSTKNFREVAGQPVLKVQVQKK